jgi:hypothetical protein
MIRHLRSFLIEIMLRTFKFTKEGEDLIGDEFSYATTKERGGKPPYYRARLREKDLVFNNVEVELKDNVDNDIFNKDFLLSTEQNNVVDTIKNEITKTIKGFAWVMVNISNNLNFSLNSNGDDFELDFGFDFKIGKDDKYLFNETDKLDFIARNEIKIVDNVNEYKFSEEVNDLYLDSTDYKKHKISIPRVPMTNQY